MYVKPFRRDVLVDDEPSAINDPWWGQIKGQRCVAAAAAVEVSS